MKRAFAIVVASLLVVLFSVSAFAESEFVLRNGIQFGFTKEQVRANETIAINEGEGNENQLWTKEGTVAGFDNVKVLYKFDEEDKLVEVKWEIPNTTSADSSDNDYEKLEKALREKYGDPLGYTNGDCYIITGMAIEGSAALAYLYTQLFDNGVGDMCDYDEWVYDYGDGHHVKIELTQYYYGTSYSSREYGIMVGYKHFTDDELDAARREKQEENSAVMNDI